MSAFLPGPPEPGEYHPAFAAYIAKAQSFADPVQKLSVQLDEFLQLLGTLDTAKRLHRYAPGKWSIQEMLGHITDAERIFAYRAVRIARADQTPLAPFEENDYVIAAEAERCDWGELVMEFEHVRKSSVLLFRHIPDQAWVRTGTANNAPLSVRALACIMIGHVAHHIEILRERYGA